MKGTIKNKTQKTLDKCTLDQGLKEQGFHLPPPPWHVFSSQEVALALGINLNYMSTMKLRGTGPLPEPFEDYRANRVHYRHDNLCAWLTGREPWEFHHEWLEQMHPNLPRETKEQCFKTSKQLIDMRLYRQPKWKRKRKAGPIKVFGGA
ncbi:hypothetical protein [Litorimonas sp. WD9-15]|uniref:hypothetical protein n=1 Tax=Litorimonas sp. WD9-15 TaxID=3418716 RepID=UPI003D0306C8